MQYSFVTCLLLALGAAAVPLEDRDTVVAATSAVAGPGQTVDAVDIEGGPTPTRFSNVVSQPESNSLPKDIADKIPDASTIASAGAIAAANAMSASFFKDFGTSDYHTCYGAVENGKAKVEYAFNKIPSKSYKSFCTEWDNAIKKSKYCPKNFYGYTGWIKQNFKAVSESESSGSVSFEVPKGISMKTALDCVGQTYKDLKEPYGKIGTCGSKSTSYQSTTW